MYSLVCKFNDYVWPESGLHNRNKIIVGKYTHSLSLSHVSTGVEYSVPPSF